jgi:hypothetical protein
MSASSTRPAADPDVYHDARWALVRRLASSPHLKNSPRLCEFLCYAAGCAIRNAPEEATEQQIGVNVFGRPPGYNSSEDSIVRTHARLLRQKLAAYFEEQGLAEELVVEIPKGHYLPVFRPRLAKSVDGEPALAPHPPALARPLAEAAPAPRRVWGWKSASLVLILLALVAAALWRPWTKPASVQSPVEAFWQPFLSSPPPLVIYSNALFVGNSSQGLRYAPPGAAGAPDGEHYVDTYTGVGELAAVHTLTRLFDQYHSTFVLKRSLLVTWDEAQLRNLIFIGSRAENPSLRVLPPTIDFSLMTGPGISGIVNHHPLPGEPALFLRPEYPLTRDYAILALLPGVTPDRRVLIFSGLMTFGTQAAVEYVCQPDAVSSLLKKVRGPDGQIRPFEAVLETEIGGGVPLRTRLVSIRVH